MYMKKEKTIIKLCQTHGETEFVLEGRGYYRCKKCRSERVDRKRKELKEKAIEYLGGKCSKCSYDKCQAALEFHHKDPSKKEFGFAHKGLTRSWDKIKVELDKCILLCANCHREIHNGE